MITLVMGAADAGPKFGTARGPAGVGLALGLVLGDVLAVGELVAVPGVDGPRLDRMKAPVPRRRRMTTAMTAGISHGGRSDGPPPPWGLRATVGRRAGVGGGARSGVGAGATGAAAAKVGATGASDGVGVPEGGE
jgi:hypothetical protein